MTEPTPPIEESLAPQAAAAAAPPSSGHPVAENTALERVYLPRIAIQFCTQCRWMLRAAYFAQELLSTFNTDLGEVALVPMTGGVFTVTIWHAGQTAAQGEATTQETVLWDRKRDGGFPEVKSLKSLVRNVIAPDRDLGHTDRALKKQQEGKGKDKVEGGNDSKKDCEDCK
ncbi:uncharacterized protein N7459_007870 [Penicillium hispanicum]|uniref:uncharacterized protein n=1 Tax=Penicillium hispanicum TaxID=1080232 RepID=UPI0025400117|nr:uncharacterized protein N7459_007870 [Penicillium hispanicum]KAJ5573443.1 hypothetical protein N7459_007870 [Penicillium hispanicum]